MSEKIKDGGPAFPCEPRRMMMGDDGKFEPAPGYQNGMSLRDWFAGQCIEEMIRLSQDRDGWSCENVAAGCYNLADAMLKARESSHE